MAKSRRQPRYPNYYQDMERYAEKDDNPALVAVRQRVPQEAAQKRLVRLQTEVGDQLSNRQPFLDLETLRNNMSMDREQAFFNVGVEFGMATGAASASQAKRSKGAKQLAMDVRALVMEAQLPPEEVMSALLECLEGALSAFQKVLPKAGKKKPVRGVKPQV